MKPGVKWTAGVVVVLAGMTAVAVVLALQMGEHRRLRVVDVPLPNAPPFATDASARERGHYLYESRGCVLCHGSNGGGRDFVNDGKGTHIAGPNITSAGVTATYQPQDWDRSIRHGVKPDGHPLMIMPSEDYNRFTDVDLAALVSYVRALAPVPGGGVAAVDLPLPARVMFGLGLVRDAAATIDHSLPVSAPVASGITVEHGRYVANMCVGCHGAHYSGGKIPGSPPDWPASANLTPGAGSAMLRYPTADAFVAMFHSGKRPDGTAIGVMPFESFSQMSDTDVRALYAFLKTLPARNAGQR